MSRRLYCCIAAALGLSLGLSQLASARQAPRREGPAEPARPGVSAGDVLPSPAASNNQQMADTIAGQLRQSGQLKDYRVDILFQDRTAVLVGVLTDQMQKDEALRIVQGVPGVERVIDRLQTTEGITRVQAPAPRPDGPVLPPPLPPPQEERDPPPPPPRIPDNNNGGPLREPQPIFSAPAPGPAELGSPRMPPYAWPTYAPYNNFSRRRLPAVLPL